MFLQVTREMVNTNTLMQHSFSSLLCPLMFLFTESIDFFYFIMTYSLASSKNNSLQLYPS